MGRGRLAAAPAAPPMISMLRVRIFEFDRDNRLLRRYERWRKAEAQTLITAMEAFKRGFSNSQPLLKLVRAVGMSGINQLPWLKGQIIAAALGNSGDLPKLAQPQAKTARSA